MGTTIKRALAAAVALFASLFAAAALSGFALGITVVAGSGIEFAGKISRTQLPRTTGKPITLDLEGEIPQPGLTTVSLQFDRAGAIFTKGLPVCRPPVSPDLDWSGCEDARVGHGEVEIEISPQNAPAFRTKAPLEIFNGVPQARRPVFVYKVRAHLPAPVTLITSAALRTDEGKFGSQTSIKIPTIASGYGWLVGFRAKIGKAWRYRGERVSLLTASCSTGSLSAVGEFAFASGSRITAPITRACTNQRGGPRAP